MTLELSNAHESPGRGAAPGKFTEKQSGGSALQIFAGLVVQMVTKFVLLGFVKNVTIVLDDEVARWVRVRAAEEDTSVPRFVGDLLREMMEDQRQYDLSWKAFSSVSAKRLRKRGETLPSREDVHERGLR